MLGPAPRLFRIRRILGLASCALVLVSLSPAASAFGQSRCAKAQYVALGAAARARALCAAQAAAAGVPVEAGCLAAAGARLTRRWAKAMHLGDCPTSLGAAAAEGLVDAFLADVMQALQPPSESRCCESGAICFAGPSVDLAGCDELLGTLGPPGSVCDGATGDCVAPPGTGGPCCTLSSISVCSAGPTTDPGVCTAAGGFPLAGAVCLPSGACASP